MIDLTGHTGELKQSIGAVFVENSQLTRDFSLISAMLDEVGIPAVSDDGVAYDLPERVRMVLDLAVITLASDENTAVGRRLVEKVRRLEQEIRVLNDEIAFNNKKI